MTATVLLTILMHLLLATTFVREAFNQPMPSGRLRASLLALLFTSIAGLLLWLVVTDLESAVDF